LFKTRTRIFWNDFSQGIQKGFHLHRAAAAREQRWVDLKLNSSVLDYLSVEDFGAETFDTHIHLSKRSLIIEGLDLREVPAGNYEIVCHALKITAARATARRHGRF
jgi:hypothetical protein